MQAKTLSRGIFWVVPDADSDLKTHHLLCFSVPCDADGQVTITPELALNSKSGQNYNHKLIWAAQPKSLTHGHPYNYYPRGRVEITRQRATIYLNPTINTDDIMAEIQQAFGLDLALLTRGVTVKIDGSAHYRCHWDEDATVRPGLK